ncbi:MAG: FecR domain-containing protein [Bacteroidota bacterium]
MTKEEYETLYHKYILGECTEDECRIFEAYPDSFELSDHPWDEANIGSAEDIRQKIEKNLHRSIERSSRGKLSYFRPMLAAASIVLLLCSIFIYFKINEEDQVIAQTSEAPVKTEDILPGENKAILILDDGSRINLDDAANGLIANESTTTIKKLPNGQLHYVAGVPKPGAEIKFNTVATPRGGQFQISLPDGSRVWLNAGSSLRFPTLFTGGERKVELTGEAYFEIAKNAAMPFKVLANNSEIRVLGTHFNVMAYSDEKHMNTTLLEGSVQILKGADKITIKPGQAATLSKSTDKITVAGVDADQSIAWKNGDFIFVDESIESIMRKVSRWYDVEVSYTGNMNNKDFTGTISRNKNVSELLRMLELTGAIHFKIVPEDSSGRGRRITVMP